MKRKGCLLACLVLAALLLAPVGAYFSAVFIGPIRNDRAAEQLRRELLESVELLPGETLVSSACFAGNTRGTGNYVRLWGGVLTYYDGPAENAPSCPVAEDPDRPWELAGPENADLLALFPTLAELDSYDGYYLHGRYGEAATQWDWRGS